MAEAERTAFIAAFSVLIGLAVGKVLAAAGAVVVAGGGRFGGGGAFGRW